MALMSRIPARSALHISDLKQRVPTRSTLANVKLPAVLVDAIERLAKELGVSKVEVTVALLNEGLAAANRLHGRTRR
jgi:hypothetical protein